MRVGNSVAAGIFVDVDPTAGAVLTVLGLSLPVASNFSSTAQLVGTAIMDNGTVMTVGRVYADPTNDRAELAFYADAGAASRTWQIQFIYTVI